MLADLLAATVFSVAGCLIVTIGIVTGGDWLMTSFKNRRETRMARIEADLDRKQDELRRTILRLAEALGAEAHEARKALIRESYLASGQAPERPGDS